MKPESEIDFSMDTKNYNKGDYIRLSGTFSITSLLFYGISVGITFIVMFLLK